eukprot:TRINITY_DN87614_c0_g1_i1.p1 TRINITY_DN87614_c0_g1~~TRINITY_DN87614_c0_g1_i1.p1  ORF type:complete len:959 (-),score=163.67 TRINITY_DN87614_c0_g1_i1:36-2834(-)
MPITKLKLYNEMSSERRVGKPTATSYVLEHTRGLFSGGIMPSQFFDGYEYEAEACYESGRARISTIQLHFQKNETGVDGMQKPSAKPLFLNVIMGETQTWDERVGDYEMKRAEWIILTSCYMGDYTGIYRREPNWRNVKPGVYECKLDTEEQMHNAFGPGRGGLQEYLSPVSWIQLDSGSDTVNIHIRQSPADAVHEDKMKALIETVRLKEESERRARERFGPDLHDDLKRAKFDTTRFNVGVVGTNNSGKSSFLNRILLMDNDERLATFKEKIQAIVEDTESGVDEEHRHVVLEQVDKLEAFYEAEGRATTWDMVREGKSQIDLDAFFANCTFWDLPGIEAADGGADGYGKHVSLNQFDLVFLVTDRMLLEDDFHLILRLQKAMIDGVYKPKGVPFFIIRTKMDLKIQDHYKKATSQVDWDFPWNNISGDTQMEMLTALQDANRELQKIDESYRLADTAVPDEHFIFSGNVDQIKSDLPYQQLERVSNMFEGELAHVRKVLEKAARDKMAMTKLVSPIPCINHLIREAMFELPSFLEELGVPPSEYVHLSYVPADGKPGFGVKQKREGLVVCAPPKPEADLRDSIGFQEDDVLVEFPKGSPVPSKKAADHLCKVAADSAGRKVTLVVLRTLDSDMPRTFANSRFKTEYAKVAEIDPSTFDPPQDDRTFYNGNVRMIVQQYGGSKFVTRKNIEAYAKILEYERSQQVPDSAPLSEAATCDWTTAQALVSHKRPFATEFCGMVNELFRRDAYPDITNASLFFHHFRDALVTAPKGRKALGAEVSLPGAVKEERPRKRELDVSTHRGTCMPRPALKFFFEKGKCYRVPFPLASSSNRNTAVNFIKRSHERDPRFLRQVRFEIDNSEKPLHVDYVECLVPGEDEYLYAPYSCFKVLSWKMEGIMHVITIKAFHDNKQNPDDETRDSEEWPLAMWH